VSVLVVVAPLKPGCHERAQELLDAGPPFALEDTRFDSHEVFLTANEVVFVFEGQGNAGETLTLDAADAVIARAAQAWGECLEERPRVARSAFSWKREPASG
jgi:hypothetical protein